MSDLKAFVEARTRLAPVNETTAILERALMETGHRLLQRAHKLALHTGSDVVNARDLLAAVRFELPNDIADAVEANIVAATHDTLDQPTPCNTVLQPDATADV